IALRGNRVAREFQVARDAARGPATGSRRHADAHDRARVGVDAGDLGSVEKADIKDVEREVHLIAGWDPSDVRAEVHLQEVHAGLCAVGFDVLDDQPPSCGNGKAVRRDAGLWSSTTE